MARTPTSVDLTRGENARARAVTWIEGQLDDDGRPHDSGSKNTWWRVPWALSVSGAGDSATSVLTWAEREALTAEADLRPGPVEFSAGASPVYELSALAIAAWRLGRYDLATALMDTCKTFQSPITGGVYDRRERDGERGGEQDLLKTCQLGIAAVVTGRRDIADPIAEWVRQLWDLQPALPHVLQTSRGDSGALVEPGEDVFHRFLSVVDFREAFQAYYNPGIAAAFLLDHGAQSGSPHRGLARSFLELNVSGTPAQFEDIHSVQICKFGWGVACDVRLDPASPHVRQAERMFEWFLDRQNDDGSWSPSTFGSTEVPAPVDRLWKTAEHLMELTFLVEALTTHHARQPSSDKGAHR